jgi:hypothetical protein
MAGWWDGGRRALIADLPIERPDAQDHRAFASSATRGFSTLDGKILARLGTSRAFIAVAHDHNTRIITQVTETTALAIFNKGPIARIPPSPLRAAPLHATPRHSSPLLASHRLASPRIASPSFILPRCIRVNEERRSRAIKSKKVASITARYHFYTGHFYLWRWQLEHEL